MADTLEQVKGILKDFTEIRGIHAAFNGFLVHDPSFHDHLGQSLHTELTRILNDAPNNQIFEVSMRELVNVTAATSNPEASELLFHLLETLVLSNIAPHRLVCEALLESEHLSLDNPHFWISTFLLIQKIIHGVDYKGVREIMKTCMDNVGTFPVRVPSHHLPQLNAIVRLIKYIFDRENSLLPAYFIVNELLKNFPEKRVVYHWSLKNLVERFIDGFRVSAHILCLPARLHLLPIIVEHSGHGGALLSAWKLDQATLRFPLKGNLPYPPALLGPQHHLLRYILQQPYSRDMACATLGLQKLHKVRCPALEEQLIELLILAMERTEKELTPNNPNLSASTLAFWQHLSTQLIFFVLFQFASFPHIVHNTHSKLSELKLFKGRDYIMWILLQFISGSIQKNPLSDFLPVLRLYDLLYPDKEPLPIPDIENPQCTYQMAAACIWIHILKKADGQSLSRPLPSILRGQHDYLVGLVGGGSSSTTSTSTGPPLNTSDYRTALLCNAFSTNQKLFSKPMAALVEAIHGPADSPTAPLSVQILDSLTIHTKMSLIHNIVTHIMEVAAAKGPAGLSPALVETYSRLLVYMEIESLGIKGFISQLLPTVVNKFQAWGILHTLLEMFSYRLHHIQPNYRVQLLTHLHALSSNANTSLIQLHLCVEMTALRLISIGFNSVDVHTQLARVMSESNNKSLVSTESEELNRALVLTIARAIHVTGVESFTGANANWFRDILSSIMQNTPHTWSSHTIASFPPILAEFFQSNPFPRENKPQLRAMVEEEFRNWSSMSSNEGELAEHFSIQGNHLFLCLIFKMILEAPPTPTGGTGPSPISPIAFKILERIGPKGSAAHLRKFCDYIVCEFSNAGGTGSGKMNRLTEAISDFIWKHNIVTFDRFLFFLVMRPQEGNDAQVCFFIIHLLLVKPPDFRDRVAEFLKDNSPEHWKQSNWFEKHKSYCSKFPETFLFESEQGGQLPVYFGNVCLRLLPVIDLIIHRYLEINLSEKSLEMILDHMGGLYKFHDRPITYLYNTLHYYENRLKDKPMHKKKLVASILGGRGNSGSDVGPRQSALSSTYLEQYLEAKDAAWQPHPQYYQQLVAKLVHVMAGHLGSLGGVDWRYNEFPNAAAHVLHCISVEVMSLPVAPAVAGAALLDVLLRGRSQLDNYQFDLIGGQGQGQEKVQEKVETSRSVDSDGENEFDVGHLKFESWANAVGLILCSLPEPYWLALHDRILATLQRMEGWCPEVVDGVLEWGEFGDLMLATHAVYHHLPSGHTHHIATLVCERLIGVVVGEGQLLWVWGAVGPFLQRLNGERPAAVARITVSLYELMVTVDSASAEPLRHMDIFCDLLYHMKYMFTGDIVKIEVEAKIRALRPPLRKRLRFITHLNMPDKQDQMT